MNFIPDSTGFYRILWVSSPCSTIFWILLDFIGFYSNILLATNPSKRLASGPLAEMTRQLAPRCCNELKKGMLEGGKADLNPGSQAARIAVCDTPRCLGSSLCSATS